MTSTFRTAGAWGAGKGAALTWPEQDNNIYDKETRIAALEAAGVGVGIDYITVSGNQMTIHMTDHSIQGPFTLPTAAWKPVGEWQPTSVYHALDVVTVNGSGYLVNIDHTSDSTFDPNATDGHSNPLYSPLWVTAAPQGQEISASSFAPAITDAGTYIRLTNAGGCTVTINSSVDFAPWTEINFRDESVSGGVTFVGGGSATMNPPSGFVAVSAAPGAVVTLKKVGTSNVWDMMGRLHVA